MVAPVLPALTMAEAWPSRTASAARTSDESFMRRTLWPGSASMAMTSDAGDDLEARRCRRARSGRPTSTTGDAELVGRPAGAGDDLAGGLVAAHGVDRDGQRSAVTGVAVSVGQSTSMAWRPCVPAAVAAHDVGQLGGAAAGADAARPGR